MPSVMFELTLHVMGSCCGGRHSQPVSRMLVDKLITVVSSTDSLIIVQLSLVPYHASDCGHNVRICRRRSWHIHICPKVTT